MNAKNSEGSVGGIPKDKPLAECTDAELQFLWEQLNRNRDFPSILKLLEGERQPDSGGELQLFEVYSTMKKRGIEPLKT